MKRLIWALAILSFCMATCGRAGEDRLLPGAERTGEDRPLPGAERTGEDRLLPGAERTGRYFPVVEGRKIALVVNHTSLVGERHLVDSLLRMGTPPVIEKLFAPEHGFRGDQDAGMAVSGSRDPVTGIPIVSLYGAVKKPPPGSLEGLDLVIFDIQDVGVRFYTYISTLHYVMEACAEQDVPLLVLDRPNPHTGYVDGPVLEPAHASFVGMHPIPVVYGLTVGELAGMINGEGWLAGGIRCDLTVIPCESYERGESFPMPVKPSPNLTSMQAVRLYPSTCFFEGTVVSEGRGTATPFEVYGHPDLPGNYGFTPVPMPGMSTRPKLEGRLCRGRDLRNYRPPDGWKQIHLHWLIDAYRNFPRKEEFFTPYFEKLAGTSSLRNQIEAGYSEERIRKGWRENLAEYMEVRSRYLAYPVAERSRTRTE